MPKWQVNVKRIANTKDQGKGKDTSFQMDADTVTLDAAGNLAISQGGAIQSMGVGHWDTIEITKLATG